MFFAMTWLAALWTSILQQLTFVLVDIFINLEHLSCPTLVLLFKLWKDKCRLEVRREFFVKINLAMLTYTHICSSLINSKIVLWSRHTNFSLKKYWNWEVISLEMKTNFQVFFNNLMLKMLIWEICSFSFLKCCCFFCMTSLEVTQSTLKTSLKFLGTAFKFWIHPWSFQ